MNEALTKVPEVTLVFWIFPTPALLFGSLLAAIALCLRFFPQRPAIHAT
jgi:uncharacterized membrane-anchored protein